MITEVRKLLDEKKILGVRELLVDEEAADIAIIFEQFPPEEVTLMFRILPKQLASEVFVEMDTEMQQALIEAFTDVELTEMVDTLFIDDTVDIIEEMPSNVVKRILKHSTVEKRAMINQLLHYPEDSAGTIMTLEFVELKAYMKVADAFESIRENGLKKETVYTCYVTDAKRVLIGVTSIREMILAGNDAIIADIMVEEPVFAHTDDDKEDVMKALAKYDFLAMPIVDGEGRLVGIVTIDDAMDVLQEEDTEDMEIMAGMSPSDKPYLKTGVFELWLKRIPWLMILMISATFSSKILTGFESALTAVPVLMAFVPQLTGTSGNAGSQASVAVIRGLSLGEIEMGDIFYVLWKEIRVSFLCGISLGIVNFIKMFLLNDVSRSEYGLEGALLISFVVCLTMALSVVLAKIVGCTLPIIAKRIGLDPAVMASPFITTIVDVVSLLTYFGIARALLGMAG